MSKAEPTPEERREAAAIRWRWVTLGEVLAVIGVLISALALWNSYSERSAGEAERAAEKAEQASVSRTLLLKAGGGGKRLALTAHDPDQAIQSQTLLFPSAFGLGAFDTTEPRIEAEWVERAVKKAHGKDAKVRGDARIPVAIVTRFVTDGKALTDTALYDVGYKESGGGLFGGSDVELRGLSLVERTGARQAQARLDAIWAARTR
ncbi:MAG: hypothetical protein JOZ90_13765 [Alphaproteobacteria bacterium]|nr:hypothetical protein [Alphaproteobacteria bacterium]MBV9372465.1 hypothetical protein [Alphaproteobacteria bacterium]MBV9902140.1 hypothetical protein [Alphaproteobacteria bacterium]